MCICIITARKQSLGQGNIFRDVCLSRGRYDVTSRHGQDPPPGQHPWSTSGRYASYWNAFLFWYHSSHLRCYFIYRTMRKVQEPTCGNERLLKLESVFC